MYQLQNVTERILESDTLKFPRKKFVFVMNIATVFTLFIIKIFLFHVVTVSKGYFNVYGFTISA
jgi:hypothetical protein